MRFTKLLCVVMLCLSSAVWAVDTDQDGLPDDWEIAQGRDPGRPDYLITSNNWLYSNYVSSLCFVINGYVRCTWGTGGGLPGTPSNVSTPADTYGVELGSTTSVKLFRGYPGNAYTNSWNSYAFPPSVADVASTFTLRTQQTSYSASYNFTVPQISFYCGGYPATRTIACVIGDSHHLSCTRSDPYAYLSAPFQCAQGTGVTTSSYTTKGTIVQIAGTINVPCALTEYGPECFGGTLFAGTYDPDGDGVSGLNDNCPLALNADQLDGDSDGFGDVCDAMPNDTDNDGVDNPSDNCPSVVNADQLNTDGDAQGDVCDTDDDNDGVLDASDKFPLNAAASSDSDNDGYPGSWNASCDAICQVESGLALDNCPITTNADQLNTDGDAAGDACDADDDNDGVNDSMDAFPADDCVMTDSDGDGLPNDIYCLSPASAPLDGTYSGNASWAFTYSTNGITASVSGVGGASLQSVTLLKPRTLTYSKTDPSNRLSAWYASGTVLSAGTYAIWLNAGAPCAGLGCLQPGSFNNIQLGWTNLILDMDDDNDSILDVHDAFPLDAAESVDTDGDTIGNNADWDDDNDGVPDTVDAAPLNAGDVSEITLPLDGNYKGLQLKGTQNAIH